MTNENQTSEQDSSEQLSSFIQTYNLEQQQTFELQQDHDLLKNDYEQLQSKNLELIANNKQLNNDLILASKGISDAQKVATTLTAKTNELGRVRATLTATQQELSTLKSKGGTQRLTAQVKRLKDTNEVNDKKVTRLNGDNNKLSHENVELKEKLKATLSIVQALNDEKSSNQPCGLYHNGDHHLVIWPQKTTMQRTDNTQFNGTNLLYLHQSGRGGFITFDPQSEESKFCDSPKGGLKIPKHVNEFANQWLYKINVLQGGDMKEEDRTAIDYNG